MNNMEKLEQFETKLIKLEIITCVVILILSAVFLIIGG